MDLQALQTTLREFAAERDWQAFHTPKNLAMALMVEAAEVLEIFQWLTPEQSQAARGDLMLQQQVADELADVLLYLVQLADHTGVDLPGAVDRKLVKNAKKHAPLRPGRPGFRSGNAAAVGVETHVLVDWENVQPRDDDLRALVPDVTDVWLFHGPGQKGVAARHASFGDKATLVQIARTGKNALDFHLSFYMGYIAARHPDARFVVVSNDKGYAPMLEHAAELGFSARQVGFGPGRASVGSVARKTAAKKAAPARKASTAVAPAAAKKLPKPPAAKKAATRPAAKKQLVVQLPAAPAKKAAARKAPAAREAAAGRQATAPAAAPPAAPKVAAKSAADRGPKSVPRAGPAAPPRAASATGRSRAAPAVKRAAGVDLNKALGHVVASLRKTANKPTRRARLVATVRSLLGESADAQAVESVLAQLMASGAVAIDAAGTVRYALPRTATD